VLCDRDYNLFADRRVLHFAPEPSVRGHVESRSPRHYDLADVKSRRGQLTLDLAHLAIDDDTYDVVLASHGLEQVPDDHRAFREMARVLAPDGVAVLMVSIIEGWDDTYEDPPAGDDDGDGDGDGDGERGPVRWYGRDFRLRVESAGFKVEEFVAEEAEVRTYGLTRGERVFLCRLRD
jgi:SAM-dependent methyltransferase